MNPRIIIMLIFVAVTLITKAQNKNVLKKETLNYLIEEAVKINPKLKMLKFKLKIAESKINVGTNLPDPVLTLGLVNMPVNTFSFTQEPMTAKIIGISQTIPFPGKLNSAAQTKAFDTLIVNEEINDLKNEIRKNVTALFYELGFVREKILLIKESESLLKQISEVVKRKYEVAKAGLQNLIQVQVQITRIQDKIEILKSKESSIISELNTILLRDINSNITTEKITKINNEQYSISLLLESAEKNKPLLKGIKYSVEKFKQKENLAVYSYYPDFKFGVQYSQRDFNGLTGIDFNDFFSVVLGITLPLNYGGKNTAKVNEAKYLQAFHKDRYNSVLQLLQQSFVKLTTRLNEIIKRERLIDDTLLTQVNQAYQAALSDYKVDRIDFANVISSQEEIIKTKTELLRLRTDYKKIIAELEFLTGKIFN